MFHLHIDLWRVLRKHFEIWICKPVNILICSIHTPTCYKLAMILKIWTVLSFPSSSLCPLILAAAENLEAVLDPLNQATQDLQVLEVS